MTNVCRVIQNDDLNTIEKIRETIYEHFDNPFGMIINKPHLYDDKNNIVCDFDDILVCDEKIILIRWYDKVTQDQLSLFVNDIDLFREFLRYDLIPDKFENNMKIFKRIRSFQVTGVIASHEFDSALLHQHSHQSDLLFVYI
jgi:hypothetical protein